MITLSYGYFQPKTGDRGVVFFSALEDNFQRLNDHSHDGNDSARLTSKSVTCVTQSILAVNWAATSGGTYKQSVTMPAGMLYNDFGIIVKLSTLRHIIYPTIEKTGASTYDIYINDNTLDLKAVYV